MDGVIIKSRPGDIHVMPQFGRAHEESALCWCNPKPDLQTLDRVKHANTVWVHEVAQ